jgi:putative aminopeptidase FrvX
MDLLRKLVTSFGPSGHEDEVAELIINEIKDYVDDIKRDSLGNVIAFKKGAGQGKIMTTAHMDQIGILVTNVDKNGYLRFANVGYVDPYVIISSNVRFKNGTIGTIWREEKKDIKNLKLSELYIDIGASSKEAAISMVNVGDFGVFVSNFIINEDRISSGALDDRIGCYILIQSIKEIKNPESDIYFVFTVQEETFISGAVTSAFAIEPESAIVVDVTDTGDTPECYSMSVKMGDGCTIKVMDRGLICHPKIKQYLTDIAEKNNIKYQYEVLEYGTTDGRAIHTSKTGVLTGVISIPSRYIHSPQEMIDMKDVNSAITLLTKALQQYK